MTLAVKVALNLKPTNLASNSQEKGCLDVQHTSKIDQNIVTHEAYVARLNESIEKAGVAFAKGANERNKFFEN